MLHPEETAGGRIVHPGRTSDDFIGFVWTGSDERVRALTAWTMTWAQMAKPLDRAVETPYLQGLVGTLADRRLTLTGESVVIGRDPSQCDLVLDNAVVSRRHAVIRIDADGTATITDLRSRKGTFINGEQVESRRLNDGDRLGFGLEGLLAFTFHNPTASPVRSTSAAAIEARLRESAAAAVAVRPAARTIPPAHGGTDAAFVVTSDRPAPPDRLRLGRAPDNDLVLDLPGISRYHALLDYSEGEQPSIVDLGSTNGTFVNGELLRVPRTVGQRDVIFLGGYIVQVHGRDIRRLDLSASRLIARQVHKEIGGRLLLKDVSLAVFPREFVGLMGPSGCGKSTLLDALNGFRPATAGTVWVNDLDLYQHFHSLRRSIGYVPQRDILHESLSVERTLGYGARLRLPDCTPAPEVRRIVDDVIEAVGLRDQAGTPFVHLSGGQQKRLSLGLELITKPTFLFLDEPTSPLDPETTENLMMLFRRLADAGRIIVMVTHRFEKFEQMDRVAILTKGGRLAFFGPPRAALQYFCCQEPADIYRQIGAADPDELRQRFLRSAEYREYVGARIEQAEELGRAAGAFSYAGGAESRPPRERPGVAQWSVLTERYLETKLKDRRNTLLLLAQAPIVALILAAITADTTNDSKTLFIAGVMALWFGANNAVREIAAELPIYFRERLVNLRIPSYVLSKFAVLSGFALIQCVLFLVILVSLGRLRGDDFVPLAAALYSTSLGGIATGLFFSALVTSTEKATSVLPLILIPQLLLSGFFKPLDDVYFNARTGRPATASEYEAFTSQRLMDENMAPVGRSGFPPAIDPISRYAGLGEVRYVGAVIIARWTLDALAHTVSVEDDEARHRLPTQMTVRAYRYVQGGSPESIVRSRYRQQAAVDLTVLAGFVVAFLGLTMIALKRRDVL